MKFTFMEPVEPFFQVNLQFSENLLNSKGKNNNNEAFIRCILELIYDFLSLCNLGIADDK